jgi:hypothetical protein
VLVGTARKCMAHTSMDIMQPCPCICAQRPGKEQLKELCNQMFQKDSWTDLTHAQLDELLHAAGTRDPEKLHSVVNRLQEVRGL